MDNQSNNSIVKRESAFLQKVSNQIAVTNKLLENVSNDFLQLSRRKKNNDLIRKGIKANVKTIIEYNLSQKGENGEVSEDTEYKDIYQYDENGNEIKMTRYELNGNLIFKITNSYNDQFKRIERYASPANGTLRTKRSYKYDNKGNEIEDSSYKSDGSLIEKDTFKYDGEGNIIEKYHQHFGEDRLNYKSTYKYDDYDKIIEINSFYPDGREKGKATFKYDDKGNEIEHKYCKEGNCENYGSFKKTYQYDNFDKSDNWLKKTEYDNDVPSQYLYIITREIEYY